MGAFNALTGAEIADDPENALTQEVLFLGEKSKTADKKALARAKEMGKAGASPQDILNETGWFQQYGKWNYEIDDRALALKKPLSPSGGKFFDHYSHPEAEAAYPELAKRLRVRSGRNAGAGQYLPREWSIIIDERYSPSMGMKLPGHELQHAVDDEEVGLSGNMGIQRLLETETRAHNADSRIHMSPEERKRIPPWATDPIRSMKSSGGERYRGKLPPEPKPEPPRERPDRRRAEAQPGQDRAERPRRKTHKPEAVGISAAVPGYSMARGGADPWKFLEDDR
jgi:hypothetical protein